MYLTYTYQSSCIFRRLPCLYRRTRCLHRRVVCLHRLLRHHPADIFLPLFCLQIANELVHSLGNVYGFSSIMHGLTSPQVSLYDIIIYCFKRTPRSSLTVCDLPSASLTLRPEKNVQICTVILHICV